MKKYGGLSVYELIRKYSRVPTTVDEAVEVFGEKAVINFAQAYYVQGYTMAHLRKWEEDNPKPSGSGLLGNVTFEDPKELRRAADQWLEARTAERSRLIKEARRNLREAKARG
jgi:hypothetical protein